MCFHGEQDIRRNGRIRKLFPFILYLYFYLLLYLYMGFPFTSAFILKDSIFENLIVSKSTLCLACIIFMLFLASMFTAGLFSQINLIWYFLVQKELVKLIMKLLMKVLIYVLPLPMIVLCFFSIFIGYLTKVYFYWFQVLVSGLSSI